MTTEQGAREAELAEAWRANRDKLLADTASALKAMGFDAAKLETIADEWKWGNTRCLLMRGERSDEFTIEVRQHSDRYADWRSHRTEHVSVTVFDVTPRRTLKPTSRYVHGRLTYTPIKPEKLAKVLAVAFDQRLAKEADDKRRDEQESAQTDIAARVNKAAGRKVCKVKSHGRYSEPQYRSELELVTLSEDQMITLVDLLRANRMLDVLRKWD